MSNGDDKKRKGERSETFRIPAIRVYPQKEDKEEVQYAVFHTLRNPNGDRKDKTNLNEVRIPMIGRIYNNAEDYCRLRARLQRDVWAQMHPTTCNFFTKVNDFRHAMVHEFSEIKTAEDKFLTALYIRSRNAGVPEGKEADKYAFMIPGEGRMEALEKHFSSHATLQSAILDHLYPVRTINGQEVSGWTMLEREFWEYMAREIFPHPGECHDTQTEYLRYDVRKPLGESFASFKARMEEIFSMLNFFPARAKKNTFPSNESMDKRQKTILKGIVRKAIFDALPKPWQEEFKKRIHSDLMNMSDEQFKSFFTKIEEEDQATRQSKKPKAEPSKEEPKKTGKGGDNNHQKKSGGGGDGGFKRRTQKFCTRCKRAGRSEAVYKSHNTEDCRADDRKPAAYPTKRDPESAEIVKMKKEFKAMKKMMAKMEKERDRGKKRKYSSDSSDSDSD